MTKTKNERITTLENEVAELKLIVHQIRESKVVDGVSYAEEPSTQIIVEDIIEFEGHQYRKVDRVACEGDVVVFNDVGGSHYFETNKPYKVQRDMYINGVGKINGHKEAHPVYVKQYNRTPETVEVYELIESKPLTPNQQRAAVIEKARQFIDATASDDTHFEIQGNQVLAWRIIRKGTGFDALTGVAVCSPSDVFNEDIGRAIAVGRMEGLDVSKFEQAVQPIEIVKGMEIMLFNSDGKDHKSGVVETYNSTADEATFSAEKTYGPYAEKTGFSRYIREHGYKILNDTNAIYGGVE
ncbi:MULTISPECIES: hypothetical protein [unclassified Lysinibacillus]|uniref:hypothetical protein n=1 Tax=unclassified Lysinibacillus TaxID=2636778 RepID=UPI0008889008|nr:MULTISPECIES: hypothetical protein [unclassified Lysinibacillus]SCY99284.1 hypothetical protein SAMN02787078_03466 [Lysinibacillus sp. SG9]SDB46945.1 hypothetical protein SAMN02787079_03597 [Lysinibacillus sp. TC-37]SFT12589.1 hypothetical protein SAMN02787087_03768 [Lysinibacillus sp. SG55]